MSSDSLVDMIRQVEGMDIDVNGVENRKRKFRDEHTGKRQRLQRNFNAENFEIQKWHDRNHLNIRGQMVLLILKFLKKHHQHAIINNARRIESHLYSNAGCLFDYEDSRDLENRINELLIQFF